MASPDRILAQKLVKLGVERIRDECGGTSTVAMSWSGGKDSQVLALLAQKAGIQHGVLVLTYLEYPQFEAWTNRYQPKQVRAIHRPLDLRWLAQNPQMLFPDSSAKAARWFERVQWTGQRDYCRLTGTEALLLGRRQADGNMTGKEGRYISRGVVRYSPMWDWSHEAVFHVIGHYKLPLPPNYSWDNGFRLGTGPWPKRRRINHSELDTWCAVAAIDRSVVAEAARYFPLAARAIADR